MSQTIPKWEGLVSPCLMEMKEKENERMCCVKSCPRGLFCRSPHGDRCLLTKRNHIRQVFSPPITRSWHSKQQVVCRENNSCVWSCLLGHGAGNRGCVFFLFFFFGLNISVCVCGPSRRQAPTLHSLHNLEVHGMLVCVLYVPCVFICVSDRGITRKKKEVVVLVASYCSDKNFRWSARQM